MALSYEDRLRRVLQYIHDNPTGDLSLDALADVAALSRFHWHRVFHAMTGETCAQAVRRIRAHRAAVMLVQSDATVARVAKECGYESERAFARTFRALYGLTPIAYRKAGALGRMALYLKEGTDHMFDVTIEDLPTRTLAATSHRGRYTDIGAAFETLSATFSARELWPHATGMIGVYYDDPSAVPEADLRSHAGIAVTDPAKVPADLETLTLHAGPHAVLLFKGPYSDIKVAYDYLYGQWLPSSGREPADAPPMEDYLNNPREVAPEELLTKICAPLKG